MTAVPLPVWSSATSIGWTPVVPSENLLEKYSDVILDFTLMRARMSDDLASPPTTEVNGERPC
jgi:hypothetical protein